MTDLFIDIVIVSLIAGGMFGAIALFGNLNSPLYTQVVSEFGLKDRITL